MCVQDLHLSVYIYIYGLGDIKFRDPPTLRHIFNFSRPFPAIQSLEAEVLWFTPKLGFCDAA